ncbi:MAG: MFS transporter, partial [Planctomycetota bacterium]
AIALYIPANFCYQIGENFLASFLPSISTPRNIGRISATGWAMGYVGALCLLALTIGGMLAFGLGNQPNWPPFLFMAGVWFIVIMSPAVVVLREPPVLRSSDAQPSVMRDTARRLGRTLRSAKQFTQLARFLGAFFVFGMGVQTVIAFAAILAGDFGITGTGLAVFVLQITITAGAAAIATGFFQDKIGAKATVLIYLVVWMISCTALLTISSIPDCPQWAFWVVGNGIGFGMGGIGTASRSMVGKFAPAHKTAEFFGLWGMVYKFAGVVGVASFSQVNAWIGMQASLALLLGFFAVGFVMTLRVREVAGIRAARRAERETSLAS